MGERAAASSTSTGLPQKSRWLSVYAVTAPAPARLRATGISGETLRVVTFARLSAVVGEMRAAPSPTPAMLRRYAESMQQLFDETSALLPARFGTGVTDLAELEFILRSRRAALRSALRHVRSRAQMTLRVIVPTATTPAGAAPALSGPVSPSRRATGTAYLRGRVADAARAREIAGFDPVRAATARWVRDERVEQHAGIATAYHLVPRSAVAAYRAAVERAAAERGLRIVISGPWPPYAFANW